MVRIPKIPKRFREDENPWIEGAKQGIIDGLRDSLGRGCLLTLIALISVMSVIFMCLVTIIRTLF